jgi:hypothetical protein
LTFVAKKYFIKRAQNVFGTFFLKKQRPVVSKIVLMLKFGHTVPICGGKAPSRAERGRAGPGFEEEERARLRTTAEARPLLFLSSFFFMAWQQ